MKALLVIPTINPSAAAQVAHGLGSLPAPHRGIVVTNGKRPTDHVAMPSGWETAHVDAPGLLAGRQYVLKRTDADILIYLDDDIAIPSGWLEKMLEPFTDPHTHFVGCRYLPDYAHRPPEWMNALWWARDDGFTTLGDLSLLDGGVTSRHYTPMLVWGLCFAVRQRTVIDLGGFHPDGYPMALRRFRGDGENGLSGKAEAQGLKAFYQGETHVMHKVPAERMTPQYFAQRSLVQGISDSYTDIRKSGLPEPKLDQSWKALLRPLKRGLQRSVALRFPTERRVRILRQMSHMAGRAYHEAQARNDPVLLEWVLKPSYADGELPPGWERYLGEAK